MKKLNTYNRSTKERTDPGREITMKKLIDITENVDHLLDELDLPHDAVQFSIKNNKVRIELSV
jgi:hypothetical protein